MGIDRQRIVDNFNLEGSEVASHFTPCAIENGCEGEEWYEFDPEAARDLLADAGVEEGFETTIYFRAEARVYLPEPTAVANELAQQLSENLGWNVSAQVVESGEFIETATADVGYPLYMLGWGADYPHITNFLDFHFGEANPQFGDGPSGDLRAVGGGVGHLGPGRGSAALRAGQQRHQGAGAGGAHLTWHRGRRRSQRQPGGRGQPQLRRTAVPVHEPWQGHAGVCPSG